MNLFNFLGRRAGHSRGSALHLRRHTDGMTLVVILLLMASLAVGGLFSARSALMGEQLARNQLDIQVARQAAEAALRDAEKDLALVSGKPSDAPCDRGTTRPVMDALAYFTANCKGGQCQSLKKDGRLKADYSTAGTSASNGAEVWWPESKGGLWNKGANAKPKPKQSGTCATFTGGVPLGTFTGTNQMVGVAQQPEYIIELIPRGQNPFFRITARGFGLRTGAEVVLQSYFQAPEL